MCKVLGAKGFANILKFVDFVDFRLISSKIKVRNFYVYRTDLHENQGGGGGAGDGQNHTYT